LDITNLLERSSKSLITQIHCRQHIAQTKKSIKTQKLRNKKSKIQNTKKIWIRFKSLT